MSEAAGAPGAATPRAIPLHPGAPERMPGMVSGVRAGPLVFLSAVRGRDPQTNAMSDDTAQQARQAFDNVAAILGGEGLGLSSVVKVTLYLAKLEYRTAFHAVWMEYFGENPPARMAVEVSDANAAPGGKAHFVLDVIAWAG